MFISIHQKKSSHIRKRVYRGLLNSTTKWWKKIKRKIDKHWNLNVKISDSNLLRSYQRRILHEKSSSNWNQDFVSNTNCLRIIEHNSASNRTAKLVRNVPDFYPIVSDKNLVEIDWISYARNVPEKRQIFSKNIGWKSFKNLKKYFIA
jgi:hypothetical protein